MPATGRRHVLKLAHYSQAEVEPMPKESSVPPSSRNFYEDDPSPLLWGLRRGLVLQASPDAVKPPLRPHPKPSGGTQSHQRVPPSRKVSDGNG